MNLFVVIHTQRYKIVDIVIVVVFVNVVYGNYSVISAQHTFLWPLLETDGLIPLVPFRNVSLLGKERIRTRMRTRNFFSRVVFLGFKELTAHRTILLNEFPLSLILIHTYHTYTPLSLV